MASRRCISNSVIETDDFLDISKEGKLLYFMLNMNADDLGFIGKPKAIARQNECSIDCLEELEQAGFIIRFESGVVCICHWLIHNTLKNDRKQDTRYQTELSQIYTDDNKVYQLDTNGIHLESKRNPNGNQMESNGIPTEDRITEEKKTEEKRREVNRSQQKQKTTEETEKQKSTEGETIPVSVSVEDEEELLSAFQTAFAEIPTDEERASIHTLLAQKYTVPQIRGAMMITAQDERKNIVWDRWGYLTGVIRKQMEKKKG